MVFLLFSRFPSAFHRLQYSAGSNLAKHISELFEAAKLHKAVADQHFRFRVSGGFNHAVVVRVALKLNLKFPWLHGSFVVIQI